MDMQLDDNIPALTDRLRVFGPDIVGFSLKLGSLDFLKEFMDFLGNDQQIASRRPVVALGGILATFAPQQLLEMYPQALVAVGEGEAAMRQMVRYARREISRENIPGIAFVKDAGMVMTPRNILPLDEIGLPLRELSLAVEVRHGNAALETSRGCPWSRCSFCSRPNFYKHKWTGYSIQRVIADLQEARSRGVNNVFILDDDFLGGGLARARELAQAIIDNGIADGHFNFSIDTSVAAIFAGFAQNGDDAQSRETLALLKKAGLHRIFLGIESGSLTQIKRYDKNLTPEQSERVIWLIRDMGFNLDVDMVFFDPDLTVSELRENVAFVNRLDIRFALSAPLNKLRAHEGSRTTRILKAQDRAKSFDLDYILYQYEFSDQRIQNIYNRAKAWEEEVFSLYYALKGLTRFYWISEIKLPFAGAIKEYLDRFKVIDFELLEKLTREPDMSDEAFAVIVHRFHIRRMQILLDMGKDLTQERYPDQQKALAVLREEIFKAARQVSSMISQPEELSALVGFLDKNYVCSLFDVTSLDKLPGEAEDLHAVLDQNLYPRLKAYYLLLLDQLIAQKGFDQDKVEKLYRSIDILARHVTGVFVGLLQVYAMQYHQGMSTRRLGSLSIGDDTGERTTAILNELRTRLAGGASITDDKVFRKWAFIVLFHDIGKVPEYYMNIDGDHGEESGRMVESIGLKGLLGEAFSDDEVKKVELLIKTHLKIPGHAPSARPLASAFELFDDQQLAEYLGLPVKVDQDRLNAFLNDTVLFWAMDSAGNSVGLAHANCFEYLDFIAKLLMQAVDSTVTLSEARQKFQANAEREVNRRLGRMIGA